jgi:hypothetical protein
MRTRDEYLRLRRAFEPSTPRLIIVAESPPASGRYFYDPNGLVTEPLFSALMKQLNVAVRTKEAGLQEFQRRGWVLVDATYEPVNALATPSMRNRIIVRDFPHLIGDLSQLDGSRTTPLILVKANVCWLLEPKLVDAGFDVGNCGRRVPFPSTGQQPAFHRTFSEILKETGVR